MNDHNKKQTDRQAERQNRNEQPHARPRTGLNIYAVRTGKEGGEGRRGEREGSGEYDAANREPLHER
jgi:hypothetical protein